MHYRWQSNFSAGVHVGLSSIHVKVRTLSSLELTTQYFAPKPFILYLMHFSIYRYFYRYLDISIQTFLINRINYLTLSILEIVCKCPRAKTDHRHTCKNQTISENQNSFVNVQQTYESNNINYKVQYAINIIPNHRK